MLLEQGALIQAKAAQDARSATLSASAEATAVAKNAAQQARSVRKNQDEVQRLLQETAAKEVELRAALKEERTKTLTLADSTKAQLTSLSQSMSASLQHTHLQDDEDALRKKLA